MMIFPNNDFNYAGNCQLETIPLKACVFFSLYTSSTSNNSSKYISQFASFAVCGIINHTINHREAVSLIHLNTGLKNQRHVCDLGEFEACPIECHVDDLMVCFWRLHFRFERIFVGKYL